MGTDHLTPYIFDEFFTSGKEESISPFLTKSSRKWAKNLGLKTSLLSALFLCSAFFTSFYFAPLSNVLLLFVYFLSGTPALQNAVEDVKSLEINIDVLMTLAAFLSFSVGSQMEGGLLLVLFSLSGTLEETVSKKAKGALFLLSKLSPTLATVVGEKGNCFQKSVSEIEIGSQILIQAGEIVPLDGLVVSGSSFVNLQHLTGESIPVSKSKGDEVKAGSRNLDGTLTICVTCKNEDSTLSKLIELISRAQNMKPRVQRVLDRFTQRYATAIIALFFLFALGLPWAFPIPYFGIQGSFYRALTFLIAASPCALIIATPIAYLSAISACARKGILLKGGVILDALASCKTIAFDKTGTLTTGQLSCEDLFCVSKDPVCTVDQAIQMAASLEKHATHPMGRAIRALAKGKNLSIQEVEDFQCIAGFGLTGRIEKRLVSIGSAPFIHEKLAIKRDLTSLAKQGEYSTTFLLVEQSLFLFCFKDTIRPEALAAVRRLQEIHKLDLAILTGDGLVNCAAVANLLGIETFFAELNPEHKLHKVSDLSYASNLAMVGDGMNDAPSLARATVGISMGKEGSSMAIDASDVVFLQNDLNCLDWLYLKARKTTRIVRENLFFALMMICSATLPAVMGWIPLWLAVLVHEGGTVLVALNGLRLLKK